jgi:RNA polymerase sigma-70 factor (sigma-E family)
MHEEGEHFVRALYPKLRGFLELHTGDRDLADELTQETLARVWARWPRVRRMASPQAYAFRIALNLARSWFRRRSRERRALARLDATDVSDEPATAERVATRAAMVALPRRQREVLLLRYFAGLGVAETADTMGCTPGTVKAHTHRALARLRQQLQVSEEPRP